MGGAWGPDSYNARPGEIFMDEDENWCTDSTINDTSKGANLLAVALHEIGHAIGLKHSEKNITSIMHSVIRNNNTKLLDDDIAAIRWLYGKISK